MDTASSGTSSPVGIAASVLAMRLGRSGQPLILDVRKAPAFDAAPQLIAGALRVAPDALAQALLPVSYTHLTLPTKRIV